MRADPGDGFPIVWFRSQHGRDAAEAGKESARRDGGNSRNGSEERLACVNARFCLWTLSVCRSLAGRSMLTPLRKSVQPKRRIRWIGRPKYGDAEVTQGKTCAAHRRRRKRPSVEIASLDKQVRKTCSLAKPIELWPKRPTDDSKVHSANGLAFDDGPTWQVVITDTKPFDADVRSTFPQEMRHAALPLMDIRNDQHRVTRLPTRLCLNCRISVAVRPLALSQGESA